MSSRRKGNKVIDCFDSLIRKDDDRIIDMHVHSIGSSDGSMTIPEWVDAAKQANVEYLGITDHNSYSEIIKFYKQNGIDLSLPMFDYKGVKIISGVEATCRLESILDEEKNPFKIHLLVYGADLSKNSPIVKLMKAKEENCAQCDFGLFRYILEEKKIDIDFAEEKLREFMLRERQADSTIGSTVTKDIICKFLQECGVIPFKSNKDLMDCCKRAPEFSRLDISAYDLIQAAHASGGRVVLAHPMKNLTKLDGRQTKDRAMTELIKAGLDGVEIFASTISNNNIKAIRDIIRRTGTKNKLLITGGSDSHHLLQGNRLGRYGVNARDPRIRYGDCSKFFEWISNLTNKRHDAILDEDKKSNITHDADGIVDKYIMNQQIISRNLKLAKENQKLQASLKEAHNLQQEQKRSYKEELRRRDEIINAKKSTKTKSAKQKTDVSTQPKKGKKVAGAVKTDGNIAAIIARIERNKPDMSAYDSYKEYLEALQKYIEEAEKYLKKLGVSESNPIDDILSSFGLDMQGFKELEAPKIYLLPSGEHLKNDNPVVDTGASQLDLGKKVSGVEDVKENGGDDASTKESGEDDIDDIN